MKTFKIKANHRKSRVGICVVFACLFVAGGVLWACFSWGKPVTAEERRELAREAQREIVEELGLLCQRTWMEQGHIGKSTVQLQREFEQITAGTLSPEDADPSDYYAGSDLRDEDGSLVIKLRTEAAPWIEDLFRGLTTHPEVLTFEKQQGIKPRNEEMEAFVRGLDLAWKQTNARRLYDAVGGDGSRSYSVMVRLGEYSEQEDQQKIQKLVWDNPQMNQGIPVFCVEYEMDILE